MKTPSSLLLASVSTFLMAVGAGRAAERFDGIKLHHGACAATQGIMHAGPALPCVTIDAAVVPIFPSKTDGDDNDDDQDQDHGHGKDKDKDKN